MSQRSLTNRRTMLSFAAAATLLPVTGSAFATGSHVHAAANAKTSTKKLARTDEDVADCRDPPRSVGRAYFLGKSGINCRHQ